MVVGCLVPCGSRDSWAADKMVRGRAGRYAPCRQGERSRFAGGHVGWGLPSCEGLGCRLHMQRPRAGAAKAEEARGPRPQGRGTRGSESPDPGGEGLGVECAESPDPRGEGRGGPEGPNPGGEGLGGGGRWQEAAQGSCGSREHLGFCCVGRGCWREGGRDAGSLSVSVGNRLGKVSPGVEASGKTPGSAHGSSWERWETRFRVHHQKHRACWRGRALERAVKDGPRISGLEDLQE